MVTKRSDLIESLIEAGNRRSDKVIVLGSHDNDFHADDLLATAVLMHELRPLGYNVKVVRSRNLTYLNENCNVIYDVGHGKYDHHDDTKAIYPNGVCMAACGKILNDVILDADLLEGLRYRLFYAVEAQDNGQELPIGVEPSKLAFVPSFNPTWGEPRDKDSYYKRFMATLPIVGNVYERMLNMVLWDLKARDYLLSNNVHHHLNGQFIELDRYCPTFEYAKLHREFLGAIYPSDDQWTIRLAPSFKRKHATRVVFPVEWRGKYSPNTREPNADLRNFCPISSARFCHPAGFLMTFEKRTDALLACEMLLDKVEKGEIYYDA